METTTSPQPEALNFELTPEQQQILGEFDNAQQLQAMTRSRGWEIYEGLVQGCIKRVEAQHLSTRNLSKEALWANHIAIQQIRDFYTALHNQMANRIEIANDPEAAVLALEKLAEPINPADLEGEL